MVLTAGLATEFALQTMGNQPLICVCMCTRVHAHEQVCFEEYGDMFGLCSRETVELTIQQRDLK